MATGRSSNKTTPPTILEQNNSNNYQNMNDLQKDIVLGTQTLHHTPSTIQLNNKTLTTWVIAMLYIIKHSTRNTTPWVIAMLKITIVLLVDAFCEILGSYSTALEVVIRLLLAFETLIYLN